MKPSSKQQKLPPLIHAAAMQLKLASQVGVADTSLAQGLSVNPVNPVYPSQKHAVRSRTQSMSASETERSLDLLEATSLSQQLTRPRPRQIKSKHLLNVSSPSQLVKQKSKSNLRIDIDSQPQHAQHDHAEPCGASNPLATVKSRLQSWLEGDECGAIQTEPEHTQHAERVTSGIASVKSRLLSLLYSQPTLPVESASDHLSKLRPHPTGLARLGTWFLGHTPEQDEEERDAARSSDSVSVTSPRGRPANLYSPCRPRTLLGGFEILDHESRHSGGFARRHSLGRGSNAMCCHRGRF